MPKGPLRLILMVTLVDLIGFGIIIPLQADYARRLGATGLTFGLLVTAYTAMQFLFNPILGRISDRVGRRPVLVVSLAGSVISHALLGYADLANSLTLMFVARTLDGITGANIATAQAYIADVTTHEDRAKGMGLFGAAFGVGFVIGPSLAAGLAVLGKSLSGDQGTCFPAFGAAAMALAAAVLVWLKLPESLQKGQAPPSGHFLSLGRLREVARDPRTRELLIYGGCAPFAFVLLETTFVLLVGGQFGLTQARIGLLFAYIGVIMVVVQGGLVGRLAARFGEPNLIVVGPFITAIGFVMIAAVTVGGAGWSAWWLLIAACIPVSVGSGLTNPSLMSLVSRRSREGRQGETLGVLQGVVSLSRSLAPPLAGFLFDAGPALPYLVGAAVFVLVGNFALFIRRAQFADVQGGSPASGVES